MQPHRQGFTLIELLIVIAIISILAGVLLTGFRSYQTHQTLEFATKEVRQIFETARSQTLAATNDSAYGVYIDTDTAVLFEGAVYDSSAATNVIFELDPRVQISDIALTPITDVVTFTRGRGEPSAQGSIELSLTNDVGMKRIITISATGIINSNE